MDTDMKIIYAVMYQSFGNLTDKEMAQAVRWASQCHDQSRRNAAIFEAAKRLEGSCN